MPGLSASFRPGFRFVRAVRAGEVKLRGCMTIVILISAPLGCEHLVALRAAFRFGVGVFCEVVQDFGV